MSLETIPNEIIYHIAENNIDIMRTLYETSQYWNKYIKKLYGDFSEYFFDNKFRSNYLPIMTQIVKKDMYGYVWEVFSKSKYSYYLNCLEEYSIDDFNTIIPSDGMIPSNRKVKYSYYLNCLEEYSIDDFNTIIPSNRQVKIYSSIIPKLIYTASINNSIECLRALLSILKNKCTSGNSVIILYFLIKSLKDSINKYYPEIVKLLLNYIFNDKNFHTSLRKSNEYIGYCKRYPVAIYNDLVLSSYQKGFSNIFTRLMSYSNEDSRQELIEKSIKNKDLPLLEYLSQTYPELLTNFQRLMDIDFKFIKESQIITPEIVTNLLSASPQSYTLYTKLLLVCDRRQSKIKFNTIFNINFYIKFDPQQIISLINSGSYAFSFIEIYLLQYPFFDENIIVALNKQSSINPRLKNKILSYVKENYNHQLGDSIIKYLNTLEYLPPLLNNLLIVVKELDSELINDIYNIESIYGQLVICK